MLRQSQWTIRFIESMRLTFEYDNIVKWTEFLQIPFEISFGNIPLIRQIHPFDMLKEREVKPSNHFFDKECGSRKSNGLFNISGKSHFIKWMKTGKKLNDKLKVLSYDTVRTFNWIEWHGTGTGKLATNMTLAITVRIITIATASLKALAKKWDIVVYLRCGSFWIPRFHSHTIPSIPLPRLFSFRRFVSIAVMTWNRNSDTNICRQANARWMSWVRQILILV